MKCLDCEGTGWVCENHTHIPYEVCGCGAAGANCHKCNPNGQFKFDEVYASTDDEEDDDT
jgi:hypothetical protein